MESQMKITIIDNNLIFADKIRTNLIHLGHKTEHFTCIYKAIRDSKSDIYLLSTSFSEDECRKFIKSFKSKIIILIADTYTHSTVRLPLDLGAQDYIIKPFRMEELVRKIDYFLLKTPIHAYQSFINRNSDMKSYDGSYIISIEEYIQFIIKSFQYTITDTELAKQLDISRKKLYDRRNKYHIYKIKKERKIS